MAYSTIDDVQKLLKWFEFSSTSKVTSDEITNEFIPEADNIIDSKLGRVYQLPIHPDDIEILTYISCRMVACEVSHVLILQTSGDLSDIAMRWCDQAKERLEEILTQDILLPNSTLLDSTQAHGGRLYSSSAFGTDTQPAPETIWKMGTQQW